MNSLRYPRSAAVYGIDERADEVQHFGMPLKEQRDLAPAVLSLTFRASACTRSPAKTACAGCTP